MNNLEVQKLSSLEVQISDELSVEELDIVSGGCGRGNGDDNDIIDFKGAKINVNVSPGVRTSIGRISGFFRGGRR